MQGVRPWGSACSCGPHRRRLSHTPVIHIRNRRTFPTIAPRPWESILTWNNEAFAKWQDGHLKAQRCPGPVRRLPRKPRNTRLLSCTESPGACPSIQGIRRGCAIDLQEWYSLGERGHNDIRSTSWGLEVEVETLGSIPSIVPGDTPPVILCKP